MRKLKDRTIRPGFEQFPNWTRAEAGRWCNHSFHTIRGWEQTLINGRRRWRWGNRGGADRIDAASFREYYRTLVPQGEEE